MMDLMPKRFWAWMTAGAILLGSAAPARAAADIAASLAQSALNDPWAFHFVEGLSTEIGQRLAGTEAEKRAADWAVVHLKAAGFSNVHIESFPMTAWLRGIETGAITSPAPQKLVLTALGGSVATPAEGVEAEVALFRSYADLLATPKGSLAGKIAVVTQRMVRVEDGSGYGAAMPIRRSGASEAASRGAVAYLLRSLGTDHNRLAHTGAMSYQPNVLRIPAAALSNPDADQLERLTAQGPVRVRLVLTPTTNPTAQSYTVAGEIKGREKPDEIVLAGAHLDSWDLGTGATDDGAGDAIMAGAARLIGALPQHPRRTIRLVLFGAEEMDFSGAAYAKAHAGETQKIVLAGEADFGAGAGYAVQLPLGAAKSDLGRHLTDALAPVGAFVDRAPALFPGSDVIELQDLGVPVVSVRQNGTTYFDVHHTANDTLDEVDPQTLAQNVGLWAAVIYLAADAGVDFRALAKTTAH